MFAEVVLRPRLEPIRPAAQINLVRIKLKDLRLRKPPLDLYRQQDLLKLPPISLLVRRNRFRANCMVSVDAPCALPCECRSLYAASTAPHQVHPPVAFKALVLD